jgi:hypothetical protein
MPLTWSSDSAEFCGRLPFAAFVASVHSDPKLLVLQTEDHDEGACVENPYKDFQRKSMLFETNLYGWTRFPNDGKSPDVQMEAKKQIQPNLSPTFLF